MRVGERSFEHHTRTRSGLFQPRGGVWALSHESHNRAFRGNRLELASQEDACRNLSHRTETNQTPHEQNPRYNLGSARTRTQHNPHEQEHLCVSDHKYTHQRSFRQVPHQHSTELNGRIHLISVFFPFISDPPKSSLADVEAPESWRSALREDRPPFAWYTHGPQRCAMDFEPMSTRSTRLPACQRCPRTIRFNMFTVFALPMPITISRTPKVFACSLDAASCTRRTVCASYRVPHKAVLAPLLPRSLDPLIA